MRTIKTIPLHLREIIEQIREVALEVYGLDFFETIFEMVDYKQMNEIAAFGGFPTRYPHWRFGMEYEQLSKSNEYGLSKIYEMVINNDPAYAYLLEGNNLVDQKTVIAHVYAHVDFFKNNYYFSKTNRKMVDEMANHGARIRRYVDRQGIEKVEDFVDTCLSLDNLIDYYSPFIERRRSDDSDDHESQSEAREIPKFKAKDYMDDYINPEHYIEEQKERLEEEQKRLKNFPPEPEKDVMLFLLEHAPLEGWEADILSIIREEAYYFAPQGQTKIMNEGWACVAADTPIFSSRGLVSMREVVEADRIDVSDGAEQREVYDRNVIADHETVTIRTRRGLGLTGSNNHRVMLADGETWCRLDELEEGDCIAVSGGANLWPDEQVPGFTVGDGLAICQEQGQVPDAILRSPKAVVAAFLQGLFDADGYAGKQGVILSTSSEKLGEQAQLLLLNFGILSRRREQSDGCWHVHVTGSSAEGFAEEIGFGLERKQAALDTYLDERKWFKEESWTDEVISVEEGREDVYDISVRTTHRYAAGGFINHNSFWHSKILTEKVLTDAEIIDFADINSKVMHAAKGQLNPYKLGVALYRDIEERWNKGKFGKEWDEVDDLERKDSWDKQLGLGRKKIFEVRKLYNDVTFIDEFLTEEFARENKMFTFGYNRKSGNWEIESRQFQEVKEKLLTQLTNFGQPFIYVKDGNFKNRGELLLHHKFDGTPLRFDYAQGVLEALHRVWKRPVNIETIVDDKGVLLSFDGDEHEDSSIEYEPI